MHKLMLVEQVPVAVVASKSDDVSQKKTAKKLGEFFMKIKSVQETKTRAVFRRTRWIGKDLRSRSLAEAQGISAMSFAKPAT